MITISKRIKNILSNNETSTPNLVVIDNTNNVLLPKQIPFYIETTMSNAEIPTLQVDIYETNFNLLIENISNMALRRYIKENGLYGAVVTSKPIASLKGEFENENLNITDFHVDTNYRGLSLGNLILGTAEDLANFHKCQSLNIDIDAICPIPEHPEAKNTLDKVKTFVSSKIEKTFNKANRNQLMSFLKDYGFASDSLSKQPSRRYVLQPDTMKSNNTLQVSNEILDLNTVLENSNHSL